ncbi:MAG: hypothetical protein PHC41_05195 [Lachnospiraceae bacterium]|nr:hypothetical protein [Lachnospiraceae bacterium]MDD3615605.1 hypothetical protein [Lachnospiraceae bacterium]
MKSNKNFIENRSIFAERWGSLLYHECGYGEKATRVKATRVKATRVKATGVKVVDIKVVDIKVVVAKATRQISTVRIVYVDCSYVKMEEEWIQEGMWNRHLIVILRRMICLMLRYN